LNEKEWAGSELLIYKNDTLLPFSIQATNEVECYAIKYDDLIHFPDDVKELIAKNAKDRLYFMRKRVIEICRNLKKVNKWDGFHKYYEDKGEEMLKQFPSASKGVMQSFRNRSINQDPVESRKGPSN